MDVAPRKPEKFLSGKWRPELDGEKAVTRVEGSQRATISAEPSLGFPHHYKRFEDQGVH